MGSFHQNFSSIQKEKNATKGKDVFALLPTGSGTGLGLDGPSARFGSAGVAPNENVALLPTFFTGSDENLTGFPQTLSKHCLRPVFTRWACEKHSMDTEIHGFNVTRLVIPRDRRWLALALRAPSGKRVAVPCGRPTRCAGLGRPFTGRQLVVSQKHRELLLALSANTSN